MSKVVGNFGRLWGRGYESFQPKIRRILSISGPSATTYLQGLVTSDLQSEPKPPQPEPVSANEPGRISLEEFNRLKGIEKDQEQQDITPPLVEFSSKLRSTCFLDHKGRIITDSLLWKASENQYYIDVPGNTADELFQHLKQHKLRRTKVDIKDKTDQMTTHVVFGTLNSADDKAPDGYMISMDPRHPSLGMRVLSMPPEEEEEKQGNDDDSSNAATTFEQRHEQFGKFMSEQFPHSEGNYDFVRRLVGVAEGKEIQGKVAIETNQEFLNAVSFKKGCYLGQELTARVHHTGTVRKRIMPLYFISTQMDIPKVWSNVFHHQKDLADKKAAEQKQQQQTDSGEEKKDEDEVVDEEMQIPKLPRMSVLAAGNLVPMLTGSLQPGDSAKDESVPEQLKKLHQEGNLVLEELENYAKVGTKIIDLRDNVTIGQIVAPPIKGTNVALAMVRLDQVGLLQNSDKNNIWKRTNRVKLEPPSINAKEVINGEEDGKKKREVKPLRYLPYLPLWWPTNFDENTGKEKQ